MRDQPGGKARHALETAKQCLPLPRADLETYSLRLSLVKIEDAHMDFWVNPRIMGGFADA